MTGTSSQLCLQYKAKTRQEMFLTAWLAPYFYWNNPWQSHKLGKKIRNTVQWYNAWMQYNIAKTCRNCSQYYNTV